MNESTSERVLEVLDPPRGGWEHLRARRDAEERQRAPWLAFAAGIGVAALGTMLANRNEGLSLTLPSSAARLQGTPVADEPLRLLDAGRAAPLPAAEGVRLYWAEKPERP